MDPHEILDAVLAHPQSREIMESALRNMIESAELAPLDWQDIATFLENAM